MNDHEKRFQTFGSLSIEHPAFSVEITRQQSTLVTSTQRIEADVALISQVRFEHGVAEWHVLAAGLLGVAQPSTTAGLHPVLAVRALSQRSA